MHSPPFAGEEDRRICTSNDGRVIPQVFAANTSPRFLGPITVTAYSRLSDLVPVRDLVWIGSPTQLGDYVTPDVKIESQDGPSLLTKLFKISNNQ